MTRTRARRTTIPADGWLPARPRRGDTACLIAHHARDPQIQLRLHRHDDRITVELHDYDDPRPRTLDTLTTRPDGTLTGTSQPLADLAARLLAPHRA